MEPTRTVITVNGVEVMTHHRRTGSRFRHGNQKKKQLLLVSEQEVQRREEMESEEDTLVYKAPEYKYRFFRTPKIGSRRIRNRLVQKQGICNISLKNVPKQRRKYFSDIFTTVIEMKWRWCLLYFSLSFCVSWTFFSVLYYTISLSHGDMDHMNDTSWIPCIVNAQSPLNCFLFSFTTQTTIGYGFRYPTDQCKLVILTMCIQFMWGLMSQTLMAGVIFSKLARPIKRAATLIFSKNAVICLRDGKLCLLFRVGDMRKSSLAEAHVRLQMIKRCITYEGELLPFHQFDMDVGYDQGLDRIFVIWPITICHEIDENSPLYEVSRESLATAKFEIIAILEGVVESVGSTTQARTSYLPTEILWGKRFEKLVHYKKENGQYNIDFSKFHNVYDIRTPCCSAKELDQLRAAGLFDENEYQLIPTLITLPTVAKGQIRTLEDVNRLPVCPEGPEPPSQVFRIDSDEEDNNDEEAKIELVDYGIRKKSVVASPSIVELMKKESVKQTLSFGKICPTKPAVSRRSSPDRSLDRASGSRFLFPDNQCGTTDHSRPYNGHCSMTSLNESIFEDGELGGTSDFSAPAPAPRSALAMPPRLLSEQRLAPSRSSSPLRHLLKRNNS